MREVVLHIGAHKTGSTSIQYSLARFDSGSDFYPDISGYRNHSIPIYTIFSKDRALYHIHARAGRQPSDVLKLKKLYLRSLHSSLMRKDKERLILSGEDISLLADDEKRRLVRFLKCYGVTVRVIMYVREPLAYSASAFQEMVKHGNNGKNRINPGYKVRIEAFLNNLGYDFINVRKFEADTLVDGDVVSDFCSILGISIDDRSRSRVNESISETAFKLLYFFNTLPISADGNPDRLAAFNQLDRALRGIYPVGKINKNAFIDLVDFPDSERLFLIENFGIYYDKIEVPYDHINSLDYISDLSHIDFAPLDELLQKRGVIIGSSHNLADKLISLYFSILHETLSADITKEINHVIVERDHAMADRDRLVAERDRVITERDCLVVERDHAISERDRVLQERDRAFADIDARRSKLAEFIDRLDYETHVTISKLPFISQVRRQRFFSAAQRRKREKYNK